MKKKALSLLLALVMCLSLLLVDAFAADNKAVDFDGQIYQRFKQEMAWKEAKAYCESLGGHSVEIMSDEEQNVVKDLISRGKKAQY